QALIDTYANPVIRNIPVADVDVEHILDILRPIWHTKTITAKRLRGIIAVILDWCANKPKTPYRAKGVNPAASKHNLEHANLPKPSKIAKVKASCCAPLARHPRAHDRPAARQQHRRHGLAVHHLNSRTHQRDTSGPVVRNRHQASCLANPCKPHEG